MNIKTFIFASVSLAMVGSFADQMDRPRGIKIGDRMTLRPYLSLSYTYDSNPDRSKHSTDKGSQWMISPRLNLEYNAENWMLTGGVHYEYHGYKHYPAQNNEGGYGEHLRFVWSNSLPNEKGWSLQLSESYRKIATDDDMRESGGRGIWRDREEFTFDGTLQRRINSEWHGTLLANYYYLDYDNDQQKYAALYGWRRTTAGAEIGYAPSKWCDLILQGTYMWYNQDNSNNLDMSYMSSVRNIPTDSSGFSLMGGIGTYATDRIKYRVLAGWSCFDYGNGTDKSNGFTYSITGNWQYDSTLSFFALGSSYYQPSERYYGSSIKVNTLSLGAQKSLVRGKLKATVDLAFRNESAEYSVNSDFNNDQDIWSARFGLNYTLNRFASIFGRVEYQTEKTTGTGSYYRGHYYDYDRLRGTVGVTLSY